MNFEALIVISAAVIFVIVARRLPEIQSEAPVKKVSVGEENFISTGVKNSLRNLPVKIKPVFILFAKILRTVKKIKLPKIKLKFKKTAKKYSEQNTNYIPFQGDDNLTSAELLEKADRALKNNDLAYAEQLYLKLASKNPQNPKLLNRLGILYLQQKNFADSRDAFLAALKLDDRIASRHYNLGLAYLGLGREQKAIVSFKKALSLNPENKKYQKALNRINKKSSYQKYF